MNTPALHLLEKGLVPALLAILASTVVAGCAPTVKTSAQDAGAQNASTEDMTDGGLCRVVETRKILGYTATHRECD